MRWSAPLSGSEMRGSDPPQDAFLRPDPTANRIGQPVGHPLLEMSNHMRLFRGIEQPRIFDTQNTGGNGAQEARAVAEKMPDAESKEAMLRIARDYERLAQQAEQRSGLAAKRAR
jgi:hypothetical protein